MKQILLGKAPLGHLQAGAVVGGGAVNAGNYLIRDDFTTAVAAGSVNGTNAEPGPGQRDTYDTGNKLVVSGGVLTIANSTGSQDPTQIYNAIQRRAGRILLTTITTISTGNHGRIGWSTSALDGTVLDSGLRFINASSIATQIAGSAGPEVGSFAANTFYEVAIILRAAGFAGLVRGGIYPNWTLMWLSEAVTTTPMFPGAQVIGAGRGFTSHYMHVPAQLWLPAPLISDGFSLSGESDGLGHAEGVAGSAAGQGGDAVAWTGAAWTVSGGKASNTPVTGGDIATDGGLEAWNSGTDLTNWTEQIAGSSTINLEASDVHGGTSAARFDIDSSNSLAKISQTITNSNGDWLLVKLWAKASVAGKIIQVDENAGSNQGPALTLTTTYQQFVTLIRATKANTDIGVKRSAGGSSSLYIDDIAIEVVTLTSLLRVADASDDDVIVTVSIERTAGSLAGLVLALDSAATPANCVFVFLDGTNYLRVAKVVGGVYTPLATTAITYVSGAELRVSKRGSSFRVYYNDAAVGSTLTIADAGIVSNTLCGLLSTSASNAFDDFTAYASGTDGAYDSVLNAYLPPPATFTVTTTAPSQTLTLDSFGVNAATIVEWGDGSDNTYTGTALRTHVYASAGTYTVVIKNPYNVTTFDIRDNKVTLNSADIASMANVGTFIATGVLAGTFNSSDVAGWTSLTTFSLYSMPSGYSGTFNSSDVAGWTSLTYFLLSLMPSGYSGTFNSSDITDWTSLTYFQLASMPSGYSGTFDSADVAGWTSLEFFLLFSMPSGFAGTFDSSDVAGWTSLTYFRLSLMPSGYSGTFDSADVASRTNMTTFRLHSMPSGYNFTIAANDFAAWASLADFQMQGNALTQAQVNAILWGLYQASIVPRTASNGTINVSGTNAAPSGTFQAATACPVTVSTPGKEVAHELLNDGCSGGFNVWATVTTS